MKQIIIRNTLLLLFSLFFTVIKAQSTYTLYVGDRQSLAAPNPPSGALYQTAWGARGAHLKLEKYGQYGAYVTVTGYFTGTEEVQCDYYWRWYDARGHMYTNHATTYYLIKCKAVTISPNPSSMTLYVGEGQQLSYSISPSNVYPKPTVQFYSQNTNVVQVNSNGYVKAVGAGSTYITLSNSMGNSATCSVKVINSNINVSSITLNTTSATLKVGDTKQLTASIYPSNATNKNVTWSSNNTSIASISNAGLVTAKSEGTATITCKASDGSGAYAKCEIKVDKAVVYVTDILLNTMYVSLNVGDTKQLTASIYPSNATNKNVTWSSNNTSIASISNAGLVTAKSEGTAIITCKASDGSGVSEKCEINVKKTNMNVYVNNITLNTTSATLKIGDTKQLTATILPNNATNKNVTWTSNNTSVASISSVGLITAKSEGTATITCKASDGSGTYATCVINVEKVNTNVLASGVDGNITWVLDKNGTLTISGKGEMSNYIYPLKAPWDEYWLEINSIVVAEGITSIGDNAFFYLIEVLSITLPNTITSIGEAAFFGCLELKTITIPNSVTSIGNSAFEGCGLTYVSIPNSVTSIGEYAFYDCTGLTSITIPSSVTKIGDFAFCCPNLREIYVESSNRYFSSVDGVLFDKSQSKIIQYPTARNNDYAIPNTVKVIDDYAFYSSSISEITLPETIEEIGVDAFKECENLVAVRSYICKDLPYVSEFEFDFDTVKTLYVPKGTKSIYQSTEGWKNFKNIVEFETNSIEYVATPENNDTNIFNMSGMKLSVPVKGINIINGKKVLIR